MIRLLVKLGQWLDTRFPEKVTVTALDYKFLWVTIKAIEGSMASSKDFETLNAKLGALEAKLEAVQKQAVHKDAVKDVIEVVRLMKEDFQSFKTSLGFNRQNSPEITAMLNGQYISEDSHNG